MFGKLKMGRPTGLNEIDAWVTMLENWADSVKEFKRECEKKDLLIAQCLPQMSKNLARTLAAMIKVWNLLPNKIVGNDNFKSGLIKVTDSVAWGWYKNVKRKVSIGQCTHFIHSQKL